MPPVTAPTSPLSAEHIERVELAGGVAGIDQTVQTMSRMAMGPHGAGSGRIRTLALDIVRNAGVEERDKVGEVVAIHRWVQQRLRYVNDPVGYELLTHAETLAFDRADGDCDDHCILEAALLGALGIPTRFVVYGLKGGPYSHVALHANVRGKWVPLEPIVKDKPPGWEIPDWTSRKVYGINGADGIRGKRDLLSLAMMVGALFGVYRKTLLWLAP